MKYSVRGRVGQLLIRSYPPSFQHRYGEELNALVDDLGTLGWRDGLNLLRGAPVAWLRPTFLGDASQRRRQRLQATITTAFVAWAATFLAAAGFAKAVDDPPLFAAGDTAQGAFHLAQSSAIALAIAVGIGGLAYWLMIVIPAVRAHRRNTWLLASAPAAIVGAWLICTFLFAELVGLELGYGGPFLGSSQPVPNPGTARVIPILIALLVYAVITLVCACGCVVTVSVALRRARLSSRQLRPGAIVAIVGTLVLGVQTVSAIVCVATAHWSGGNGPVPDPVQSTVPVAVLAIAFMTAGVSSWRGAQSLRG